MSVLLVQVSLTGWPPSNRLQSPQRPRASASRLHATVSARSRQSPLFRHFDAMFFRGNRYETDDGSHGSCGYSSIGSSSACLSQRGTRNGVAFSVCDNGYDISLFD